MSSWSTPTENLAFPIVIEGEADLPEIWPEPLPIVVEALRALDTYDALRKCYLI
jgi:hypothetical protein